MTIIAVVVRSIATAILNYKAKKVARLTESEKQDIANIVTANVLNAVKDGFTIDIDAQIEKATNKRISAIENSQNQLIEAVNHSVQYSRATMSAVGDFRTISDQSKAEIATLLKGVEKKEEKVAPIEKVEQPTVEVKVPEKVSKIKY